MSSPSVPIDSNSDIFAGLGLELQMNDTMATAGSSSLEFPITSADFSSSLSVDQQEYNKRVRINRSKHKRVNSDPNVLNRFVAEQQNMKTSLPDRVDLREYGVPPTVDESNLPDALPISIGSKSNNQKSSLSTPPLAPSTPPPPSHTTPPRPPPIDPMLGIPMHDNVLEGMDDFLNSIPLGDLPNIGMDESTNLRHGVIQREVNQLQSKRKRHQQRHQRHHSNPAILLHNLDQIRAIAKEKESQHSSPNPFSDFNGPSGNRTPSIPENFHFDNSVHTPPLSPSIDDALKKQNRRQYKCGRCGKPKVGHVCTMPEQRNNYSQVDLGITKGFKAPDLSYKVLTVKTQWIPTHEDHDDGTVTLNASMMEASMDSMKLENSEVAI